ncbi:DUF2057 family protein [Colwellia sp.]|uniref:YccT family protein n=1 Tax=Colwellia sp. TaxID=56799 RepID=UPI0025C3707C|nr:DUF2057 family protein [Colwellia sp.]
MSDITTRTPSLNAKLVTYLIFSVLLCSFFTFKVNATKLTLADNLILHDVDDKAVEHGFLSKKQSINLTQGEHTLVIKYKDVFEDLDFAEERLVTSDYFVVKFTLDKQQALFLSTSNIRGLAAAERFANAPEVILLDEKKQEVVLALETLSDYKLAKQVTKVITTLSEPVVTTQSNNTAINVTTNEQVFNNKVIENLNAVPMLKYWWQKASHAEKASFIEFIKQTKSLE